MDKKYISVDVEASGRTPGKYSMLSLGACIVGDTGVQFYRELKPISRNFVVEAIRVGAKGLKCLADLKHLDQYNTKSKGFDGQKVLDVLYEKGDTPERVMKEYARWIIKVTKGFQPVEVAAPIKFDGMFTTWYFDNFYEGENPLGYGGDDISSLYCGVTKNMDAKISQLGVRDEDLPHNALEDAIIQARELEKVLELMKKI